MTILLKKNNYLSNWQRDLKITWTRAVLLVDLLLSFAGSDSEPPFSSNLIVSKTHSRFIVYWHQLCKMTTISDKSAFYIKIPTKRYRNMTKSFESLTFCWVKLYVLPRSFKIDINESNPIVSLSNTYIMVIS